ncbi:MAG: baseplate J/gp47 family protein [Treponemataceae bacterium]
MAKIKRYKEIMDSAVANMIARQDKVTDFNEGSIIHTILDTISRLVERAYVAIRQGYNEQLSILPYSPFKMEKKDGLYSSGKVIFSRENKIGSVSVIPKGTRVSGGGLFFVTTESGTIMADSIDSNSIEVVAELAGSEGNLKAYTIDGIETVIPVDIVSVRNDFSFSGGTDEETDVEFEQRFKSYINGLSGTNTYAIKNAALSINKVRSVSVQNHKPLLNDIYNISIYVDDGSGGAEDHVINEVKNLIEGDGTEANSGHLAPGINIRVLAPTIIPVDIDTEVFVFATDIDTVEEDIRLVISSYVNGLTIGKPVILSELIKKVMDLSYVKDITIKSPPGNIEPSINQIARLGTLKIVIQEIRG